MNARCWTMAPLILLTAALQDGAPDFQHFADGIDIPAQDLSRWKEEAPSIVEIVGKRENWVAWARQVHERTGLFDPSPIAFRMRDLRGAAATTFDLSRNGVPEEILSKPDLEKLRGKGGSNVVLLRMRALLESHSEPVLHKIVMHELTHAFINPVIAQKKLQVPQWIEEGLACYAAGQNYFLHDVGEAREFAPEAPPSIGRSLLFFQSMARVWGKPAVKDWVQQILAGKNYQESSRVVTGLEWNAFLAKEKEGALARLEEYREEIRKKKEGASTEKK